MYPIRAARIDERAHVLHGLGEAVIADSRRPRARRVAALVRRQTAIALNGETGYDTVPARVRLREAVQQDHHWPVFWTGVDDIED